MKERSAGRSAACPTCHKTFARSDTLLRHEKSHHTTEDRGPVHRVTNGTFRACRACATARSRCSGGNPCGRCNIRKMDCVYPNKRRRTATANDEDDNEDDDESKNNNETEESANPPEAAMSTFHQVTFMNQPSRRHSNTHDGEAATSTQLASTPGSSRRRISVFWSNAHAKSQRVRQPPDRALNGPSICELMVGCEILLGSVGLCRSKQ
jgi:hypothetical protein